MAEIRVEAVHHRYGTTDVLRGLTLEIGNGEAHALLGASGAGKTTLLKILSGLLAPTAGSVSFDGADVTRLTPRERNIAQVFQFPVLYESLSVADNLGFPLRNRGLSRAQAARRAAEIAALLDIEPLLDARPAALTPYEKQLVALGRGLSRTDVAAVLLDEPLTAVESAARWRLRRVLKTVIAELGITMIYVTHDQLEALTFADRVSVMSDGVILQTGTPRELVESPAHAFVGHFIGSPGMNLLKARVQGGTVHVDGEKLVNVHGVKDGRVEFGFRPEDARLADAGTPVEILSVDVLGERDSRRFGVLHGALGRHRFALRGVIPGSPPFAARLAIDRFHLFADGVRLHATSR